MPGVTNAWTQPIINRIDMLNTGVRTQLGVKIFGPDLKTLEQLALRAEGVLRKVPGAADLYTERMSGGQYLNIEPDRASIARFGVPVGVVLDAIETAVGGMNVTTTVEGRARFPVQVRYLADYRDDVVSLEHLLITIPREIPTASDDRRAARRRHDHLHRARPAGHADHLFHRQTPSTQTRNAACLRSTCHRGARVLMKGTHVETPVVFMVS